MPRSRKQKSNAELREQNVWSVPSETTSEKYTVNLARRTCTCPYWRDKRKWCKHLEAGRIWKARVRGEADGEDNRTVADLEPVPNPYKQEPWYDALCAQEEKIVREFARCLGARFSVVRKLERKSNAGRPGYSLGDFLVCGIVAGYLNRPSRKAIPLNAVEDKLVCGDKAPKPPTLRAATKRPEMRDAARKALRLIAECAREIDTVFTLDATVMKTPLSRIHLVRAAGKKKKKPIYKILNCKVHLAVGVETFIVYGVTVTNGDVNDQNGFTLTMEQFADYVRFNAVLADAGYDNSDHYEYVGKRGGTAFIDMSDMAGRGEMKGKEHYNKSFRLWKEDGDEWNNAYGHRWLSESANSSFKRTIKRVIRARYEETRDVEVLFATLAFSLKWLAQARAKHRIDIPWADEKALKLIDDVVERCNGRRRKATAKAA